jgi:hypothetical protein
MRRSIILLLLAVFFAVALSGSAHASTYLVCDQSDVTAYDVNKSSTWSGDDNMCWAAAASNILAWAGWGAETYTTATSIFQYFTSHWTNAGSLPAVGWYWWLTGEELSTPSTWSHVDVSGGGFWSGVAFFSVYDEEWGGNLLAAVDNFFDSGYGVVLAIYTSAGGGHALTCWGYDTDADGNYTGVYVTDSDDGVTDLIYYAIIESTGGVYYLDDFSNCDSWYIGGVEGLALNHAPLPPGLLLFGSGLLALVGWRRFRRD